MTTGGHTFIYHVIQDREKGEKKKEQHSLKQAKNQNYSNQNSFLLSDRPHLVQRTKPRRLTCLHHAMHALA